MTPLWESDVWDSHAARVWTEVYGVERVPCFGSPNGLSRPADDPGTIRNLRELVFRFRRQAKLPLPKKGRKPNGY